MRRIRLARTFLWSSGLLLTLLTTTATLLAQSDEGQCFIGGLLTRCPQSAVPEIDGATVGSAVACLVGGYLMLLSRFRHKR